jgi:glycine/D-amino acid oxidase-like deaminating enzyme
MSKQYDAIIIGGGFFGLNVAGYLKEKLGQKKVLVLEKESDVMQRASYNNQARVHNGYHYPRSLLTALRSRVNFPVFASNYEQAVVDDFDNYYAVARTFSKVSARQFKLFCDRIGAEITQAPKQVSELFDPRLTEDVFKVKEFAFDADKLRGILVRSIDERGVTYRTKAEVVKVEDHASGDVLVHLADGSVVRSGKVFNCGYSLINKVNLASGLPVIGLKHELTEMALIKLPQEIKDLSVTVMCGPFFSFMPFPSKSLHTLSHVRYTPHSEWHDSDAEEDSYKDGHQYLKAIRPVSHYKKMIADATRYIPAIGNSTYKESVWETKTVLPQSEHDDSRPILFKADHGIKNYICILGSKLDNVYDVYKELDTVYA